MKPLLIVLVAAGGLLGTFLRYKITASPLLFGSLSVNVLIVNVVCLGMSYSLIGVKIFTVHAIRNSSFHLNSNEKKYER